MELLTAPSPASPPVEAPPLRNRYVYVEPGRKPVPFDPRDASSVPHGHAVYTARVLAAAERAGAPGGLTVYVTWDRASLPSYGRDVVAVLFGEEWSRAPAYADRVLATFKWHGAALPRPAGGLTYGGWLDLVRWCRIQSRRLPERARRRLRGGDPAVYALPVGYGKLDDLPIKPLTDRAYDLYFSGSVDNRTYPFWKPERWLQTPKGIARREMAAAAEGLARRRPDLAVELDLMAAYAPNLEASGKGTPRPSYSEEMMDTRVCLVPRGTTLETARLYEGLRSGCVVVTDVLPDRWYLGGVPALQLRRWRDLPRVVEPVLDDPARLQALQDAGLRWWTERASEAPVGLYVARTLLALR